MRKTTRAFELVTGLAILYGATAHAGTDAVPQWIKAEAAVDGAGTIYLSPRFTEKSGTFAATPESITDTRTSIDGTFLVGTWRMQGTPGAPALKGMQGEHYDEMITTELIDCANGFGGTLRTVEKLRGKVVRDDITADKDIMMVQTSMVTVDTQLCELHTGKVRSKLQGASR
ncbi:hypothetical protein [Burkholderia sp. Ax-1719]|uniref:hypothetical protein n=1 Tax=Burkholderia sp. Ax-1719 TaxID=2608334 RepID=UPI001424196E|nr:hypothetical protein [Burkholderia sp. Ax-1719]NIE65653.1 hypothetical protein [Burkholderia sp. Ax-1719]